MKKMKFNFTGVLPERFEAAMAELAPELGIELSGSGAEVELFRAPGPEVRKKGGEIRIGWAKPVHAYRAISLLAELRDGEDMERAERSCFETGYMVDASRNAVPNIPTLKAVLRKMALMGMDCAMMYTEETYEVPEYPYFGYMRGRYTQKELAELDDYAFTLGIELIPFIQTLGHLNRALRWPEMQKFMDNGEVLLCDDEETYKFIAAMLRAASAPYRTRRIHIGMDEAHGIGLGRHVTIHGYEPPHDIIRRHLKRVRDMCVEMGLKPMMWGDMFFRPDSPTGGYYDTGDPTPESIASALPDVGIMYWDYYHEKKEEHAEMLRKHRLLGGETLFAGGLWTWSGPAPDYKKALANSLSGLEAAKEAGVPFCVGCAWGDNGAETNILASLAGMQLYAEFEYTGGYDEGWMAERLKTCCGGELERFYALSRFNTVPGMKAGPMRPVNAAKFLLYQDPLVQLYADDTAGMDMASHYKRLEAEYGSYAGEGGAYALLWEFYEKLARALSSKCLWHQRSIPAVRAGDRELVRELAEGLTGTIGDVEELRLVWRRLWNTTNKPYGFEIIDGRLGAVEARLSTARDRCLDWASGGAETLPELYEKVLSYTRLPDGSLFGSYAVGEIVSACKIDI